MKRGISVGYMSAALLLFILGQAAPVAAQSFATPVYADPATLAAVSLAAKVDTTYVEDYNGDRVTDMQDVLWLIRNGATVHGDSLCDYDRNGRFSLMDVMALLVNIRQGRLTPVIHGGVYLLKGRVMEGAAGLSGVSISVRGSKLDTTFLTSNIGVFRLTGMENGSYVVRAFRRNYRITPDSLNVTINGDSLMIPDIRAVYSAYGVIGKVLDDSLLAVPMVSIRAVGAGRDTTVITDGKGKYNIVNSLPAGVYILRPSREYYTFTPDSLVINMGAAQTVEAPLIKAKFNNPTQITLYKVSGRITCSSGGVTNIVVIMVDQAGNQIKTMTDGYGGFYFLAPNGKYTIFPMPYIGSAFNPTRYDVTVVGSDYSGIAFFQYGVEFPTAF